MFKMGALSKYLSYQLIMIDNVKSRVCSVALQVALCNSSK